MFRDAGCWCYLDQQSQCNGVRLEADVHPSDRTSAALPAITSASWCVCMMRSAWYPKSVNRNDHEQWEGSCARKAGLHEWLVFICRSLNPADGVSQRSTHLWIVALDGSVHQRVEGGRLHDAGIRHLLQQLERGLPEGEAPRAYAPSRLLYAYVCSPGGTPALRICCSILRAPCVRGQGVLAHADPAARSILRLQVHAGRTADLKSVCSTRQLGELMSGRHWQVNRRGHQGVTWKLLLRAKPTTIVVHVTLDGRTPLCSICCSASRAPCTQPVYPRLASFGAAWAPTCSML